MRSPSPPPWQFCNLRSPTISTDGTVSDMRWQWKWKIYEKLCDAVHMCMSINVLLLAMHWCRCLMCGKHKTRKLNRPELHNFEYEMFFFFLSSFTRDSPDVHGTVSTHAGMHHSYIRGPEEMETHEWIEDRKLCVSAIARTVHSSGDACLEFRILFLENSHRRAHKTIAVTHTKPPPFWSKSQSHVTVRWWHIHQTFRCRASGIT